jgi:hypothetical protein
MPAHKKHPSARARRNKASTAATLTVAEVVDYSEWTIAELRREIDDPQRGPPGRRASAEDRREGEARGGARGRRRTRHPDDA